MRVELGLGGGRFAVGTIDVAKCSGDITAEGFDWPRRMTLAQRKGMVLDAAVELELVPVAAVPLYRGERRIILVDPAWPTS